MPSSSSLSKAILLALVAITATSLAAARTQQAAAMVDALPTVNPVMDQTVDELATLTFNVTASDPDGQQLSFALHNAPYGASIDAATGSFTWTPTEEQGPGVYHIDVIVSDGMLVASQSVMIVVNDVGGGGHGHGKQANLDGSEDPVIGTSGEDSTSLTADPASIPLDGTTDLKQTSSSGGILVSLTVQEPDGDVCAADAAGSSIPSGGLTVQYPTGFGLMTNAGDGLCDTGDVGTYQADSVVRSEAGTSEDSTQFQTESPFVLPESPIGLVALVGSALAALGAFTVVRGRVSRI